jgi:hypothetical protein
MASDVKARGNISRLAGIGLRWLGTWLGISLAIVLGGAVVGAVLGLCSFPVFAASGHAYGVLELVGRGLVLGGKYAGIWAMGTAIVLCFVIGHRRRTREAASPSSGAGEARWPRAGRTGSLPETS